MAVSPAGRWWFQVRVIWPVDEKDKHAWAPGYSLFVPNRPKKDIPGLTRDEHDTDITADLDLDDDTKNRDMRQGDGDMRQGDMRLKKRGAVGLCLSLLGSSVGETPLEVIAYEHEVCDSLTELVASFRGRSKAEHEQCRGNYGKILLQGPLHVLFTRCILLHYQNIATVLTCQ